uniref:Cathepsin O-like n=1 Tax=Dermatophagoides pteronyssinus TaxID=6956 RepID=A0A6P6XZX3_DERPT|nr:cathepsin O-like [Dermatophagoides pteronyssinus]
MLFLRFLLNLLIVKQSTDLIQIQFEQFIDHFEKSYKNNPDEYIYRIKIFEKSLKKINFLNQFRQHKNSALFGLTKYSDLTEQEFKQIVLKNNVSKSSKKKNKKTRRNTVESFSVTSPIDDVNIPQKFDWRDKNAVSQIRDQGECGACWAYSIATTVESMLAIKTNKTLREFSTQQLVDCSENHGCNGGDICSTLEWMSNKNISLETLQDYPSKSIAGNCQSDSPAKHSGVRIQTKHLCENLVGNERQVIRMIANHGPVIATVDASTWQNYLGGIIQYHCFNNRNHAVQITGYDLSGPIPYYRVRNTWNLDFGINGYVHIAIGDNLCGIAEEISSIDLVDIPKSFL